MKILRWYFQTSHEHLLSNPNLFNIHFYLTISLDVM